MTMGITAILDEDVIDDLENAHVENTLHRASVLRRAEKLRKVDGMIPQEDWGSIDIIVSLGGDGAFCTPVNCSKVQFLLFSGSISGR